MSGLYAMRRANGDWFALDERGSFRVPVFRSGRDGMLARVSHTEMLLFEPAALDAGALGDLVGPESGGGGAVHFWLVDAPFSSLKRGRQVERAQLAAFLRDASRRACG